jgi:hypothetical protein
MKLHIKENSLYADNMFLCYCDAGNGRNDLPVGRYEIAAQYSHAHGRELAHAYDLGWIGDERGCDVVLGRVRGRNGVIPSPASTSALLARLEVAEDAGRNVVLEVK